MRDVERFQAREAGGEVSGGGGGHGAGGDVAVSEEASDACEGIVGWGEAGDLPGEFGDGVRAGDDVVGFQEFSRRGSGGEDGNGVAGDRVEEERRTGE